MPVYSDKHKTLQALRQQFGSAALEVKQEPLSAATLSNGLNPALFASGLHEMIAATAADRSAALAFALGAAIQNSEPGRVLFCAALAHERQETGLLYGAGLHRLGVDPARLILLAAPREKALLWAAEEAASCPALGAAVIVLGAREKLYGFTASRRLKLRQERSGVPLFLVRATSGEPTAATARWRIAAAPSQGRSVPGAAQPLLGSPRWRVCLERHGGQPPREWDIDYDEALRLRVAAPVSDRPNNAHRTKAWRAA